MLCLARSWALPPARRYSCDGQLPRPRTTQWPLCWGGVCGRVFAGRHRAREGFAGVSVARGGDGLVCSVPLPRTRGSCDRRGERGAAREPAPQNRTQNARAKPVVVKTTNALSACTYIAAAGEASGFSLMPSNIALRRRPAVALRGDGELCSASGLSCVRASEAMRACICASLSVTGALAHVARRTRMRT